MGSDQAVGHRIGSVALPPVPPWSGEIKIEGDALTLLAGDRILITMEWRPDGYALVLSWIGVRSG